MFYQTPEEFESAWNHDSNSIEEMFKKLSKEDRTLVYGYNLDRDSVHIYMMGGEVHLLVYRDGWARVDGGWVETDYDILFETKDFSHVGNLSEILPSKRIYPESVDREFMERILIPKKAGNFTTFDPKRAEKLKGKKFHGFTKAIL